MSKNIFEQAVRTKLRFESCRGSISVEQLWDTPLRSKNGDNFNLDSIARVTNRQLKATSEESFVDTEESQANVQLRLAMDVIKYVIATKLKEEEARKTLAQNRQEKARLLEILAEKKAGALSELSVAELEERIAAL